MTDPKFEELLAHFEAQTKMHGMGDPDEYAASYRALVAHVEALRAQRDALQAERDAARKMVCESRSYLDHPASEQAGYCGWGYLYEEEGKK